MTQNSIQKADKKALDINIKEVRNLSLHEIDQYGASIQDMINTNSSAILQKTNMNELGSTRDKLDELQSIIDKQNKKLPTALSPLSLIRRFTGGYVKVQTKIDNITDAIEAQREKLDEYVECMIEHTNNLDEAVKEIRVKEDALNAYASELESAKSTDQIRLQAVANRLKIITSTRVNAEQAQVESLMIIKANQESKYQLEQVKQNVVPILRTQAVNAIGIKANQESIEIAERTRKITGDLMIKNAEDINKMAKDLQNGRTRSPIDEDKLNKAQSILIEAMNTVAKASSMEAESNINVAESLRKNAESNQEYIRQLSKDNK